MNREEVAAVYERKLRHEIDPKEFSISPKPLWRKEF